MYGVFRLLTGDLGLSRSVSLRVCPLLLLLRFCYNNIRTYNYNGSLLLISSETRAAALDEEYISTHILATSF